MNQTVHIFLGEGIKNSSSSETTAFMIFVRATTDSDYNLELASDIASQHGFSNCSFNKAGNLTECPTKPDFIDPYNNALSEGSSIVIYND